MKKVIFILFLLIPIVGFAKSSTKDWNEGDLQWSDFQGTPIPDAPTRLKTILEVNPVKTTIGNKTKISLSTAAKVDRNNSYADSTQYSDQRLRYHQLQFDLLEVYRRSLQKDLNLGMTGLQAEERAKYYRNQYETQLETLAQQTDKGSNEAKLQEWEYTIRKELEQVETPGLPEVIPGAFSYGFYLGTGALFPTGDIDKAFSGAWIFQAGLQLGWNRLKLKSDIAYGQPRINNPNIMNVVDQSTISKYASYLGVAVAAGYTILDTDLFSITPNIGGYWSDYSWNAANYVFQNNEQVVKDVVSLGLSDFNLYFGVDFDYHFNSVVSNNSFFGRGNREQFVSSIRLTPFISWAKYNKANPALSGCQVGITVAYLGIGRSLTVK